MPHTYFITQLLNIIHKLVQKRRKRKWHDLGPHKLKSSLSEQTAPSPARNPSTPRRTSPVASNTPTHGLLHLTRAPWWLACFVCFQNPLPRLAVLLSKLLPEQPLSLLFLLLGLEVAGLWTLAPEGGRQALGSLPLREGVHRHLHR